jgi:8-oxo-dGTP diphosphatase
VPPQFQQHSAEGRYAIVPRTLIFLRRGESFLLMRGDTSKPIGAGQYNGVGGHVERGEDSLGAAARELAEETGLTADLWLCGTVIIDAGAVGVGLYVFCGLAKGGELRPCSEGSAEWIPYERVPDLDTVEDLPALLERIRGMRRGDVPFAARSHYDEGGHLQLEFTN